MICRKCGKESGNYEIWVQPNGIDPPICYCVRIGDDGILMDSPPCTNCHCYADVTYYLCQYCGAGRGQIEELEYIK